MYARPGRNALLAFVAGCLLGATAGTRLFPPADETEVRILRRAAVSAVNNQAEMRIRCEQAVAERDEAIRRARGCE